MRSPPLARRVTADVSPRPSAQVEKRQPRLTRWTVGPLIEAVGDEGLLVIPAELAALRVRLRLGRRGLLG